jgi:carboxymethylenebutenolidase
MVSFPVHFYDAGHACFNHRRPEVYHRESAELAWKRTVDFPHRAARQGPP